MRKCVIINFSSLLCLVMLFSLSCSKLDNPVIPAKKITVVATLFPLYDLAKHIAGEKAHVILLVPPGVEAHSFEPKPGDILKINKAGLFLYTGKYMEPWAEKIIRSVDNKRLVIVDASAGIKLMESVGKHDHEMSSSHDDHRHGVYDPHIWLDFANTQKMVNTILAGLIEGDPLNKDYYLKNAISCKTQLQTLDEEYRKGLSQCSIRTFVHGGHFAFNYLARRYNLHYVSAYEGSPNAEPSPKHMAELKNVIDTECIGYVFYEEMISSRIADVLAKETGTKLLQLNGAHNVSKKDLEGGTTFFDLMRQNLINLRTGLECK